MRALVLLLCAGCTLPLQRLSVLEARVAALEEYVGVPKPEVQPTRLCKQPDSDSWLPCEGQRLGGPEASDAVASLGTWVPVQSTRMLGSLGGPGFTTNPAGVTLDTTQSVSGIKTFTSNVSSYTAPAAGVTLGLHTNLPGVWFASGSLSLSNYILLDAGPTILNDPDGSGIALRIANANKAGVATSGLLLTYVQAITVADNAVGASAATATLTPSTSYVSYTCSDADGCTITLSETGAVDGTVVRITNVSANTVNFSDSSGVSELAGAFAMGQYDSLELVYATDRWVEVSRSNN